VQDHTHRAEQEVDDMDDDMPSDSMNDSEILSSDGGAGFDHPFGEANPISARPTNIMDQ